MEQKSFLCKNEQEANVITTNILLWATLAFPALIILGIVGVFNFDMQRLYIFSTIGAIGAVLPFVLRKLSVNDTILKYSSIVISTLIIGILNTNHQIGINMLYIFPITLSCLYFDRKLTWTAFIVGYANLILTLYLRFSFSGEYATAGELNAAYISNLSAYTIEYISLSLIFTMLTRRTRNLLEGMMDSEEQASILSKLKDVMLKSSNASNVLADSVSQLSSTMEDTAKANDLIANNASQAADGCEKNLKYIENTTVKVESISTILQEISLQSQEMYEISESTDAAAEESEKVITQAIENMKDIETSTYQSKVLINRLGDRSVQVGKIIEMITSIAGQTNLLALNAAIESARAGEQGKGFAVVAEEIRKLAEQSAGAAKEISNLIKHIQADTNDAVNAMDQGSETIKTGIDMVRSAGKSFEKLRELQEKTNTKVHEISSSSIKTSEYGQQMVEIVENIKALTMKSQEEVESIASSTQHQSAAMEEIAASFEVIDEIARDLLNLSKSIENDNLKL
ncbi:MAG: methyl-accepting chemotaxis protein [Clostridia bacterium]|nr:methyl-accepting chemotaxis protein [Clostridia bacterium]